jgi:hypothetical protein
MADKGTGVAIAFDSSFLGDAVSFNWTGIAREAVNVTTLATTDGMTYEPADQYDPGEWSAEILFDPADAPSIQALAAAETITVTWSNAAGTTWACEGFMTNMDINAADSTDRVRASLTGKFSGDITIT